MKASVIHPTLLIHSAALEFKHRLLQYSTWYRLNRTVSLSRISSDQRSSLKLLLNTGYGAVGDVSERAVVVNGEPVPGLVALATGALLDPVVASELSLPELSRNQPFSVRIKKLLEGVTNVND